MGFQIQFDKKALADFTKLDNSVKKQLQKFLDKLAARDDPHSLGEELKDNLSAFWKYRVGDYRIVAEIREETLVVLLLVIAPRCATYKTAKTRLND